MNYLPRRFNNTTNVVIIWMSNQVMACRMANAKPLSKPIVEYFQLDP